MHTRLTPSLNKLPANSAPKVVEVREVRPRRSSLEEIPKANAETGALKSRIRELEDKSAVQEETIAGLRSAIELMQKSLQNPSGLNRANLQKLLDGFLNRYTQTPVFARLYKDARDRLERRNRVVLEGLEQSTEQFLTVLQAQMEAEACVVNGGCGEMLRNQFQCDMYSVGVKSATF